MDGIPIHVLKALASLQNQISHVHAKRTDACDLFIGFAYFEFARFLGQFRINSKRLLYFTHKSHTGPPLRYIPMIVCKGTKKQAQYKTKCEISAENAFIVGRKKQNVHKS